MNMTNTAGPLDLDTVQAFVLIADLCSFTRAAEALDTSQAAVSLKLKRLEDRLGYRLVERTPRRVRVSNHGAAFLAAARDLLAANDPALAGAGAAPHRLRLGISDQGRPGTATIAGTTCRLRPGAAARGAHRGVA